MWRRLCPNPHDQLDVVSTRHREAPSPGPWVVSPMEKNLPVPMSPEHQTRSRRHILRFQRNVSQGQVERTSLPCRRALVHGVCYVMSWCCASGRKGPKSMISNLISVPPFTVDDSKEEWKSIRTQEKSDQFLTEDPVCLLMFLCLVRLLLSRVHVGYFCLCLFSFHCPECAFIFSSSDSMILISAVDSSCFFALSSQFQLFVQPCSLFVSSLCLRVVCVRIFLTFQVLFLLCHLL